MLPHRLSTSMLQAGRFSSNGHQGVAGWTMTPPTWVSRHSPRCPRSPRVCHATPREFKQSRRLTTNTRQPLSIKRCRLRQARSVGLQPQSCLRSRPTQRVARTSWGMRGLVTPSQPSQSSGSTRIINKIVANINMQHSLSNANYTAYNTCRMLPRMGPSIPMTHSRGHSGRYSGKTNKTMKVVPWSGTSNRCGITRPANPSLCLTNSNSYDLTYSE